MLKCNEELNLIVSLTARMGSRSSVQTRDPTHPVMKQQLPNKKRLLCDVELVLTP